MWNINGWGGGEWIRGYSATSAVDMNMFIMDHIVWALMNKH
jgi:hypothetical protein